MLNTVLKSIPSGNPRAITNWDRYVMTIKLRTEIMRTRFLGAGFVYNNGTSMLAQMIRTVVTPTVLACKSDFKRYVEYLDPSVTTLRAMFDPVYNTRLVKNVFTEDPKTCEYILNVSMEKPLTDLPLDKPLKLWEDLAPVRVIYHDARELVTDLFRYQINFKGPQPSHIIYSVDIVLLLFKYTKYVEHMQSLGQEPTVEDYLQRYVYQHLFDDLRRIWLFNILQDVVSKKFGTVKYTPNEMCAPSQLLNDVVHDIYRLIDDAHHKAISIADFCATRWFGDMSLYGWLKELQLNLQLPKLRQYKYLEFLSTFPYAKFLIDTIIMIGRQDVSMLSKNLIYELHQYQNQNITMNVFNPELRVKIQELLSTTIKYAEHTRYL
jgi:hypothetical protein